MTRMLIDCGTPAALLAQQMDMEDYCDGLLDLVIIATS